MNQTVPETTQTLESTPLDEVDLSHDESAGSGVAAGGSTAGNTKTAPAVPEQQSMRKSSSQIFDKAKGLGIITKRPSETMLKNIRLKTQERPISNDSITSSSEFSEDLNSRNSSLTSDSITGSPIANQTSAESYPAVMANSTGKQGNHAQLKTSSSTPKLSKYNNSTLSVNTTRSASSVNVSTLTLTPSQKYRLRRQNSKHSLSASIRDKEKLFDQMDSTNEQEDTFESGLMWNVPYTKGTATIFSSASGKSSKLIKTVFETSEVSMPVSPLPGSLSSPNLPTLNSYNNKSNNSKPFYSLPDETAASITNFYQESSENYAVKELDTRNKENTKLPIELKQAAELGLDDYKFISREKAEYFSPTRPSWLPPKSISESKKHEQDINRMIEHVAKLDRKKNENKLKLRELHEKWVKKYDELNEYGITRSSSIKQIRKLVFKLEIPKEYRKKVWLESLEFTKITPEFEDYQTLNTKLQSIKNFPIDKEDEIDRIIGNTLIKYLKFQKTQPLNKPLKNLLKLKIISQNGLSKNDEILFGLLLLRFNEEDAFNLSNLIKIKILNEVNMNKFNNNLSKNFIMKKYLDNAEFYKDFSQLNSDKILEIFKNVNPRLIYQILDIFVLNQNYKIFYSYFLTLLRYYHFGFNSLNDLSSRKFDFFEINIYDTDQFFERFYFQYKKF